MSSSFSYSESQESSFAKIRDSIGSDSPTAKTLRENISLLYSMKGNYERALRQFGKSDNPTKQHAAGNVGEAWEKFHILYERATSLETLLWEKYKTIVKMNDGQLAQLRASLTVLENRHATDGTVSEKEFESILIKKKDRWKNAPTIKLNK